MHTVGHAAYHGKALLVPATTITTRLPATAARYAVAPPRTGKRGRPRSKGARRGRPVDLAATAQWRGATITRYCRSVIVEIADIPGIWYGAFGNTPGRTVLVREPGDDRVLAVSTTDTDSCTDTRSSNATRTAGRSRPPSPRANNCSASARPATACSAPWNAPCR